MAAEELAGPRFVIATFGHICDNPVHSCNLIH